MSNAIIIRTNEQGQLRAVCRPQRAQRWHIPFPEMNSGVWSSAQEYPERHVATSQQKIKIKIQFNHYSPKVMRQ
jgi:hypothetical protein